VSRLIKTVGAIVLVAVASYIISWIILFIIFFFGFGQLYWWPWWSYFKGIETVLSEAETRGGWSLSPGAEKIMFRSGENYVLMSPTTNLRHVFKGDKCSPSNGGYRWLDDKILLCSNLIIDTDDLSETAYTVLNASEVNWEILLEDAETIYAHKSESGFVFVLAQDYKHNPDKNYLITEVKNIDKILQDYPYVPVLYPDYYHPQWNEKIYSPNEAYYYIFNGSVITIYEAKDDKKLSQTPATDATPNKIGGWAKDSSGVYFQYTAGGNMGRAISSPEGECALSSYEAA
jgi:hypothetical protein